jgi:phosphoglycolate phosphatase
MPFPRLLIFDLDGTLIDSQIDLANAVNATLAHFAKPPLPIATIANYIGDGAATLVRRALNHEHIAPHDEATVANAVTVFLRHYHAHMVDHTTVYPGVLESLTNIRATHPSLPMAVLTNKPVIPSRLICTHFGLTPFLFQNYGGNSFPSKKPSPEGLLALMAEASALNPTQPPIQPSETVMIGDSHVDIETARAAGTRSLGCTYGLSPRTLAAAKPDLTVHQASDWPTVLGLVP